MPRSNRDLSQGPIGTLRGGSETDFIEEGERGKGEREIGEGVKGKGEAEGPHG